MKANTRNQLIEAVQDSGRAYLESQNIQIGEAAELTPEQTPIVLAGFLTAIHKATQDCLSIRYVDKEIKGTDGFRCSRDGREAPTYIDEKLISARRAARVIVGDMIASKNFIPEAKKSIYILDSKLHWPECIQQEVCMEPKLII